MQHFLRLKQHLQKLLFQRYFNDQNGFLMSWVLVNINNTILDWIDIMWPKTVQTIFKISSFVFCKSHTG